ncbi:MAG TPA: cupin domain-containing protein [Devosiaceae bacterium]|jgi:mannose-6-phosphate isomerase-like protein (cupin superfamily)
MTTIVNLEELIATTSDKDGVKRRVLADDGLTMQAELLALAPQALCTETVPGTADRYWFVLSGLGKIGDGAHAHALVSRTFAIAPQGATVSITNTGETPLVLVAIVSPLPGSGVEIEGYTGPLHTVRAADVTLADEPQNKKQRAHFVGRKAIRSGRADGMIVHYVSETVTNPHRHPDADSIFVVLEGALTFVNGREETELRPGQAAFINAGHRHGTRVPQGHAGAAFLEFHVPARFETIQDP